jgi:hypothetical protein
MRIACSRMRRFAHATHATDINRLGKARSEPAPSPRRPDRAHPLQRSQADKDKYMHKYK